MRNTFLALLVLATSALLATAQTAPAPAPAAPPPPKAADIVPSLTQLISPDDPKLFLGGRWDLHDPKAPTCEWSACTLTVRFTGTALGIKLEQKPTVFWDVDIDDKPQGKLEGSAKDGITLLAADLPPGQHTVTLAKRTEAFMGAATIKALCLQKDAQLLPVRAPKHRIEVIGDSITCGYGDECKSFNERFAAETEDAWQAYGALVAKRFGAEYLCVAWSGKKMAGDNTLGEIYDKTLPNDPKSPTWDNSKPAEVILINLSTNDFSHEVPDEEDWVRAYKNFVLRIHKLQPKARIYLLSSPMISDVYPANLKAQTTLVRCLDRIAKDLNNADEVAYARFINIPTQDYKNGYGADYHPSLATHWDMADQIVTRLQKDLGWDADPAPARPAVFKRTKLPHEETPPGKYIAWDGDTEDGGGSWTAPYGAEEVYLKKTTDEAHGGKACLHFHVQDTGAYTGFGWNFFNYWPQDASVDSTQYKNLVFWVKVKAAAGQGPNLLNVQLNCSATKKASANVQIPKYCPNYDDGEWHEVVIPLKDLVKKGYEPTTVWEIDIGQWAQNERTFDVYIDDIQLTDDSSADKKN